MLTLHHKIASQPDLKVEYPHQPNPQILRSLKPAQFLNNLEQLKETESQFFAPLKAQEIYQQGAQTDRIQEVTIRFPKIQQNSSQLINKPLTLMPESKHNQLKVQLQNIFSQQNSLGDSHIILPGLHKQRKESHMFIKMIEDQLSFPNQETQSQRIIQNRFTRRGKNQTQSQTNLETPFLHDSENSQQDDLNTQRKVEFQKRVKVINLQNGRIATEVIKEEDEIPPPVKVKRKFVSQKTKFFPENQNK
ncbi:unnamed protein product (macronuclear) [Paramecium tetraurelia]|uniref:Uncharacterized protein n=1 Tax=Paramecium tetraurelia TaxID=5888 RepID=A0E824_PARTE|nr:uncharacterized protein GSPATT00024169001 [Paramecium tetraurelia]CAK91441.1 unnamed protein product [Paramecium tetraurelia]|eukprot:XP_001458838.1 hypothetical protein (macronuclear) [Paramecium tetraurelia strain d4-2]